MTLAIPEICPVCGAEVPRSATACPGCGADERTGWNDEATRYDGLDLPQSAYDDERGGKAVVHRDRSGFWKAVAVGLMVLMALGLIFY